MIRISSRTTAKTSGATGLQIYVPLETGRYTYEQTRAFVGACGRRPPERGIHHQHADLGPFDGPLGAEGGVELQIIFYFRSAA